ncbi:MULTISPECIES: hypothetical protein [unclassified Rhodococcus (in: high G+C Gram-positive bacteria)]|uniref:hypothetical protein n=1 Tax=unclassified Rhodococcus (in: high G+C Gram-positive bacteria) TaxID=192944 RepID=UPI001F0FE213|nr:MULTISPECIES: hypothetical protein [unclassified Rhodococcus (in: high G+C Gram-positive bacteria)]
MTVQVASSPHRGPARSTAAQRAYQRRNQRAAQLGVPVAQTRGRTTGGGRVRTRIPFVATILALLGVGMAATLLLTSGAAEDTYHLSTARAHNETLIQQRAVLQRDVEAGNSAPVLAVEAAKLGMIPSSQVARIVVAEDGSVRVVGEAVPAQGAPPAPLNRGRASTETRGQAPLSGSAGVENPRPLSEVGEEPTPRPSGTDALAENAAPRPANPQTATPELPNAGAPGVEAEQLVPVSEMPRPEDAAPQAAEALGAGQPAEPEDGRR